MAQIDFIIPVRNVDTLHRTLSMLAFQKDHGFRAHVVDVDSSMVIFELTGSDDKVTAFLNLIKPYGIAEVIRTGLIALERGEHTIYEHCEEREYYGKNLL